MICKNCGKQNMDDAKFCTCCGNSLRAGDVQNVVNTIKDVKAVSLSQDDEKTALLPGNGELVGSSLAGKDNSTSLQENGDETMILPHNDDDVSLLGYAKEEQNIKNNIKAQVNTPIYNVNNLGNQVYEPVKKEKRSRTGLYITLIIVAVLIAAAAIVATIFLTSPSVKSKRELSLGQKFLNTLDYEEAIAAFEQAIEIDPKCVEAYIGLAEAYVALDDYESAIEVLEDGYKATKDKEIKNMLEEIQEEYELIQSEIDAEEAEAATPAPEVEEVQELDNSQQIIDEYLASLNEGFEVGDIFPDFEMTDHNGNTVYLSDYRGNVLYLNFFTTWCPYCLYELPDMESMKSRASVLLVDVDPDEGPADADAYLAENGFNFEVNFHRGWDVAGYEIEGVPTSFVLDEYGIIRATIVGQAELSWMENAINEAETAIYNDLPELANH